MAAGSNPIKTFPKDPDAVSDYTIDWVDWLAGDVIATVAWVVPVGINQTAAMNSGTTATIWLGGGTSGTNYGIVCRITTMGIRTEDRTIQINVLER